VNAETQESPKSTELELWLIRHGETEWSASGKHTSRSEVPLTARGRQSAQALGQHLAAQQFSMILTSPRRRAQETCRIAGYSALALVDENLAEWDYGHYEGRTTDEFRGKEAGWTIWGAPVSGGESIEQVAERARSIIQRAERAGGKVALFSHAHFLRILAAVWIGLTGQAGRLFVLGTGSVSVLGLERETRVIQEWNRSFEGVV
jgi:broad specificity phosphatase PhoE